jgi:hypothetical protein
VPDFWRGRFSISVDQHQSPSGVRWLPCHFLIAAAYGQRVYGAKTFRHVSRIWWLSASWLIIWNPRQFHIILNSNFFVGARQIRSWSVEK